MDDELDTVYDQETGETYQVRRHYTNEGEEPLVMRVNTRGLDPNRLICKHCAIFKGYRSWRDDDKTGKYGQCSFCGASLMVVPQGEYKR